MAETIRSRSLRKEPTKTLSPATRTTFGRRPTVISLSIRGGDATGVVVGVAVRSSAGRRRSAASACRRHPSAIAAITPRGRDDQERGGRERRAAASLRFLTHSLSLRLKLSIGLFRGWSGRSGGRRDGRRLDRRRRALGHEPLALGGAPAGGGGERGAAEIAGGRVALLGILRERALDHRRRRPRGRSSDVVARLRRRLGQVRPQRASSPSRLNGHLAGERVEEQAAERVDVRARVDALAADLLGRDVVERADPVAGLRAAGDRQRVLREPEVRQVDVVVGGQQDVRGLDVAVHEAGGVRLVQRRADLRDDPRRPLGRQPALAPDEAADVVAGDVAHRDVRDPALVARVIDRDDVGVIDRRRDLRLAHEPVADRLVLEQPGRDDLQRDRAIERELRRPVDDAHAAAAGDRLDPVAGEDGAGFELTHRGEVYRTVRLRAACTRS